MTYENHAPHIARHYTHAKEKHPHFADELTQFDADIADMVLASWRALLESDARIGKANAQHILDCETREVLHAYAHGDLAHAIEECYDAVAVLLRMADMIYEELNNKETK